MTPPDDDAGVWQWGIGIAIALLSGLIGGIWSTRGTLAELEHTDADHEARIGALELHKREMAEFCDKRKAELLAELAKEVCNVVRLAIKDVTIENNSKLASISTNQALQGQLLQQIQDDVAAIFGRMNRRNGDKPPHGVERRRFDGYEETDGER